MYSYDTPSAANANLNYGFKDYEIFGYTPSATSELPGPKTGKGPMNLSGLTDGTYTYDINQTDTRAPVMTIKNGGATVETRKLSAKIEFGAKTFETTDPTGKSVVLDLPTSNYQSDDQIDPVSNASQVEGAVNSKLQASGGISFDKAQWIPMFLPVRIKGLLILVKRCS